MVLGLVALASLLAGFIAPSYAEQFRDSISAPPSARFLLGTDDLGRDRFARLLYGTRVSLLLAPAAALLSTLLAAVIGGLGGLFGRKMGALRDIRNRFIPLAALAVPAYALGGTRSAAAFEHVAHYIRGHHHFPAAGVSGVGKATPARIIRAGTRTLVNADYLVQARASGISAARLFWRHLLPNLRPILLAQFWISVPVFILSEAKFRPAGPGSLGASAILGRVTARA